MSILPTVTIKTDSGLVVINESDFDPKEHKKATVKQIGAARKASAKGE